MAALSAASAASAVTLNQSYYSVQYSTASSFTIGTMTVTINSAAPALAIPAGDYFRFGVGAYVTNNPDPEAGTAYDADNQNYNNAPPLPATLGLATFGYSVFSSDVNGSVLTPLRSSATAPANSASTARLNAAYTFDVSGSGDVAGGQVGTVDPIFGGNVPPFPETTSGVDQLGQFTAPDSYAFRSLAYRTNPAVNGAVTLTPTVVPSDTYYFSITALGTVDAAGDILADPTIINLPFTAAGDSLGALPPLSIVTYGAVPEPSSAVGVAVAVGRLLLGRRRRP